MKHKLLKALAIMIVGISVLSVAAILLYFSIKYPLDFIFSVVVIMATTAFFTSLFWALTYLQNNRGKK